MQPLKIDRASFAIAIGLCFAIAAMSYLFTVLPSDTEIYEGPTLEDCTDDR